MYSFHLKKKKRNIYLYNPLQFTGILSYYFTLKSNGIELDILISCYSIMFPNRQKKKNENRGNLVLISPFSESNTMSDMRRTHLLSEMVFNYLFKMMVLTILGARIEYRPSGPNSNVCSSTPLLTQ